MTMLERCRWAPMSGAEILQADTIDTELTERELGERAMPVGALNCALG